MSVKFKQKYPEAIAAFSSVPLNLGQWIQQWKSEKFHKITIAWTKDL
jgi:hypothetical protein